MVNNIYMTNIDRGGGQVNRKLHELSVIRYELLVLYFFTCN